VLRLAAAAAVLLRLLCLTASCGCWLPVLSPANSQGSAQKGFFGEASDFLSQPYPVPELCGINSSQATLKLTAVTTQTSEHYTTNLKKEAQQTAWFDKKVLAAGGVPLCNGFWLSISPLWAVPHTLSANGKV
jgi:hypothetical protein